MEFVSFEIAKKLKEKGFRELCVAHYDDCLTLNCDSPLTEGRCFCSFNSQGKYKSIADAPTIEQASKWVRDEFGILVRVSIRDNIYAYSLISTKASGDLGFHRWLHIDEDRYTTYEEVMSAGIANALELV